MRFSIIGHGLGKWIWQRQVNESFISKLLYNYIGFSFYFIFEYPGLQASLLVRHTETEELFVNFDPILTTLMKETECMARMGLEIPPVAMKVHSTQDSLKSHHNDLKVLLEKGKL